MNEQSMIQAADVVDAQNKQANVREKIAQAGKILKQAREKENIELVALAAILKVPVSRLEALENAQLSEKDNIAFVRALAQSICRYLKIDAHSVLELLPQNTLNVELYNANQNTNSLRKVSGGHLGEALNHSHSNLNLRIIKNFLVVFVLGIVLIGGWFLWHKKELLSFNAENTALVTNVAADDNADQRVPREGNDSAVNTVQSAVESTAALQPVQPVVVGAQATDTPVAFVTFKASANSALTVRTRKGIVLLSKTLTANSQESIKEVSNDQLPLKVTVGRADVMQIDVKGKPLDILPFAKGNVARFEIKE